MTTPALSIMGDKDSTWELSSKGDPSWAGASAAFAGLGDLGDIENKQITVIVMTRSRRKSFCE